MGWREVLAYREQVDKRVYTRCKAWLAHKGFQCLWYLPDNTYREQCLISFVKSADLLEFDKELDEAERRRCLQVYSCKWFC